VRGVDYRLKLIKRISVLLGVFVLLSFITTTPLSLAYGHTFSSDESASFLALVEQIRIETQLASNNNSSSAAQQHAHYATELLNVNVTKEITERNTRIGMDLPAALNDLEGLLASSNPNAQTIKDKVEEIDDLLGEAVSVRIESQQLSNSTVNALSFALLVNSILDHYYKAVPRPDIVMNQSEGVSEPLEKAYTSGKYRVQASWSPPEIMAGRANTYLLKFLDGTTGEQLTGTIRYDFMFMPASDPEVMIIHRAGQTAPGGEGKQTFTFKESRVGSNILRISGYSDDVDFPITVILPNNNASSPLPSSLGTTAGSSIVNVTEYQTAQALTDRIQELFGELKMSAPANSTDTVSKVEDGIRQLKLTIDSRGPIEDVEVLVHGQIHPNLQQLYHLRVIPEFPLPLLMVVSALGGVVAATRLKMSRTKQ
jgi:hypothetical protein